MRLTVVLIYLKMKPFVLSKNYRNFFTMPIYVLNTILSYKQKSLDVLSQGIARKTSEIWSVRNVAPSMNSFKQQVAPPINSFTSVAPPINSYKKQTFILIYELLWGTMNLTNPNLLPWPLPDPSFGLIK